MDDGVLMLEFAAAGVEIAGFWDEPDFVSVKVRDPDGYVVEAAWDSP
jgi:hypothetical protein